MLCSYCRKGRLPQNACTLVNSKKAGQALQNFCQYICIMEGCLKSKEMSAAGLRSCSLVSLAFKMEEPRLNSSSQDIY